MDWVLGRVGRGWVGRGAEGRWLGDGGHRTPSASPAQEQSNLKIIAPGVRRCVGVRAPPPFAPIPQQPLNRSKTPSRVLYFLELNHPLHTLSIAYFIYV